MAYDETPSGADYVARQEWEERDRQRKAKDAQDLSGRQNVGYRGGAQENQWGQRNQTDPFAGSNADAAYFQQQGDAAQQRGPESVYGPNNVQLSYDNGNVASSQGEMQNALALQQQAALGTNNAAQAYGMQQVGQAVSQQRSMAESARGALAMGMAQATGSANAAGAANQIRQSANAQQAADMAAGRAAYLQGTEANRGASQQWLQQQQQQGQYAESLAQQNRAANDAYASQMYGDATGIKQHAQTAYQQALGNEQNYLLNKQEADRKQRQATYEGTVKPAVAFLGSATSMSDERSKEAVSDASPGDVEKLLGTLKGAEYKYKPEYENIDGASKGEQFGPASAQAIAATKLGKSMVKPGEDGILRIDGAGAMKALLSISAHLNDKVKKLEERNGR